MNPVLIHIGYPKTGSTWLQRHVTDNPALGLQEAVTRPAIRELIVHPHELWYDPAPARAAFAAGLAEVARHGRVPVLTHERLAGNPASGGHDSLIIARRLRDLLPEGRVLIVIREQRSHLSSIFNEYVAGGGPMSLQEFARPAEGSQLPLFDLRYLEFHRLIERYHELFGREHVLVLPYELLQRDPTGFCNRILDFTRLPRTDAVPADRVRPSVGPVGVGMRRRLNRFAQRNRLNPGGLFHYGQLGRLVRGLDRIVPGSLQKRAGGARRARVASIVAGIYGPSNRRVEALTGLSLAELGYELTP